MSLISSAVFDQEGTGRTGLTERYFNSLLKTVDFRRHRIVIIDNASCIETQKVIMEFAKHMDDNYWGQFTLFHNKENVGTAKAVNQGLKLREPGEHCLKIDNDVEFGQTGWIEEMEDAIRRNPRIGILGLKRKDLGEAPFEEINEHYRTTLKMLPHVGGERWLVFEEVKHGIMGTCTMFNPLLLDAIGYLYQPTIYGWDDGLISTRSKLAGFVNGFLPHINIDHIDPGNTFYQTWKEAHAGETIGLAGKLDADYRSGKRPIYEEG